jgi:anti-sigma factor RsiW
MFQARHLQEDRLFDCYVTQQGGEPIEPTASEHLTDCAECHARYAALRTFMDGLRAEADAELDDVFPAERVRAQQQQIARRLELLVHPARVITFPRHAPDPRAAASRSRVAPRWVGAAAAAGLVLGLGLGTIFYPGGPANEPGSAAAAIANAPAAGPVAAAEAPVVRTSMPEPVTDTEQFLSELELALERPHTPELFALDAMTPHVREISVQLR